MSLARAFTALTGASAVSLAAQLVRGKLAALLLGPAGVGIFNQLSLAFNLFSVAGGLGANNGIIQHGAVAMAAGDEAALRRLVSTSTLLLGGIACLFAALGVLGAPWLSDLLLADGGRHADLVRMILLAVPIGVSGSVYRALLSASRGVRQLVRAQIFSDIGGAIVFVALIIPLGLAGAILGFMATHLFFLILGFTYARRTLGAAALRPRARYFSWAVVRSNAGFGASGLIMIGLSNLSVLFVSRLVIEQLGLEANGIFSNAWRIASVYLGAVTAATISYYLPTLTRATTEAEMAREVNATLRFYLYVLPLLMAAIMTGGELLVWLILSSAFLPVAALLLIFIPAELIRIIGETLSVPFLARRRMLPFTGLYILQASTFVLSAALLIGPYGLAGAVAGYALSVTVGAMAAYAVCRTTFGLRLEWRSRAALGRAFVLIMAVAAVCYVLPFGMSRIAACTILCLIWIGLTLREEEPRALLTHALDRLHGSPRITPVDR